MVRKPKSTRLIIKKILILECRIANTIQLDIYFQVAHRLAQLEGLAAELVVVKFFAIFFFFFQCNSIIGSIISTTGKPIRGQYLDHVITLDQSEAMLSIIISTTGSVTWK